MCNHADQRHKINLARKNKDECIVVCIWRLYYRCCGHIVFTTIPYVSYKFRHMERVRTWSQHRKLYDFSILDVYICMGRHELCNCIFYKYFFQHNCCTSTIRFFECQQFSKAHKFCASNNARLLHFRIDANAQSQSQVCLLRHKSTYN